MSADRTDEIRAALVRARRRGHVAMLDEALELLAHDDCPVARAIVLDVRKAMAEGLNWTPEELQQRHASTQEWRSQVGS